MQRFQVKPDEPDKEASYIQKNIQATRSAFGLDDTTVTEYDARTQLSQTQLSTDAATLPGIRLVDPQLVSDTFQQLQQVRGYYSVPQVLDVDRYPVNGQERDVVIAAREMNLEGLPDTQKNWANEHTVYTHGFGLIAAFGNQRNATDLPVRNDGEPVWAEEDLPPRGALSATRARTATGRRSTSVSRARSSRSSASPPAARTSSSTSRRAAARPGSRRPTPTTERTASGSATSSASCSTQ